MIALYAQISLGGSYENRPESTLDLDTKISKASIDWSGSYSGTGYHSTDCHGT